MTQQTTALRKISAMKKRIRMIRGGQGAGKTFSILTLICNSASGSGRNWLIASEELTKMKDSVISDFETVMKDFGIWEECRWNKSELVYSYPSGAIVKFRSMDKEDAGKGVRKFYGVYFNEINKIKFEAYNQYASRCRLVIGDWNPDAPFFVDDQVLSREDCEFLQLTYADNEMLDPIEREEILGYLKRGYINVHLPEGSKEGQRYHSNNMKDPYWANKWQVYGLGNIGALLGAVFNNWEIIEDIPSEARLRSGGGDFGFTNDPSVLIARYQWNGCPVYDEICYETEMSNAKIAQKWKNSVLAFSSVYWDSAEPKSVDDLRKTYKLKAVGVDKGSDSLRFGIEQLQKYEKIYVTRRSINIISNLRNYVWETDRNGKSTNRPVDKHNHAIDAMRYEEMGKGKYSGKYMVR